MVKMWTADQPTGRRRNRAAWQLGRDGPEYQPVEPPDPQREAEALALIVPADPLQQEPYEDPNLPDLADEEMKILPRLCRFILARACGRCYQ